MTWEPRRQTRDGRDRKLNDLLLELIALGAIRALTPEGDTGVRHDYALFSGRSSTRLESSV